MSPNLLRAKPVERNGLALVAKRAIDMLGSVTVLMLSLPLYPVIAIATCLDSPGPVFYKGRAIGQWGKPFGFLKFRSMVVDADEALRRNPKVWAEYCQNLKIADDPRITRVGRILRKSSLDELPQFLNVLRGEMSLVGPRLLSHVELARYGDAGDEVLTVQPGITGLWQVSGRHTVSFERRLQLDLHYIHHWNLWLDVVILARTIPAVLTGKGAG